MVKKSFGWMVIFATCIACTNREQGKTVQGLDYPVKDVLTEEAITTDDSISVVTGKLLSGMKSVLSLWMEIRWNIGLLTVPVLFSRSMNGLFLME